MMEKLIHPQEVEVFYLLPALRRDIAISLKELGKDQKQIAKILGVSEPSVSHYFNSKRATEVEFTADIKTEIKKISTVINTPHDALKATQRLLKMIHEERDICKVCHDVNKASIPKGCTVCYY
ncbi:helix-turn-helix domain-containing protein [Candidatus Woesearchaeota archaeon]|nr:helix-turn-helix domain-containing protein [Candidatus Woesearchaeota archaeon]